MTDELTPRENLLHSLRGGISLSHTTAEAAGQPTAEVTLSKKPLIKAKVYTKPVADTFGGRRYERPKTYFWADLYVGGQWISPNTPWAHDPRSAIEETLHWWSRQLAEQMPYGADMFEGFRHVHYHGYGNNDYLIEGTHPDADEVLSLEPLRR